ncbi:hypothetical protein X777_14969, partial [Ooceraea biroi]
LDYCWFGNLEDLSLSRAHTRRTWQVFADNPTWHMSLNKASIIIEDTEKTVSLADIRLIAWLISEIKADCFYAVFYAETRIDSSYVIERYKNAVVSRDLRIYISSRHMWFVSRNIEQTLFIQNFFEDPR